MYLVVTVSICGLLHFWHHCLVKIPNNKPSLEAMKLPPAHKNLSFMYISERGLVSQPEEEVNTLVVPIMPVKNGKIMETIGEIIRIEGY
ncbi:hypothetical protein DSO57_1008207 [Entomophthora muscae]|uniref:Uncharacterized protein n=1 Tax=Entomophthora muscae TaxID=34485 RepID=A0ACC2SW44_9FUNG|nr:hypothetical protein DSO57_1008207 [Entomophthora muscae]